MEASADVPADAGVAEPAELPQLPVNLPDKGAA